MSDNAGTNSNHNTASLPPPSKPGGSTIKECSIRSFLPAKLGFISEQV